MLPPRTWSNMKQFPCAQRCKTESCLSTLKSTNICNQPNPRLQPAQVARKLTAESHAEESLARYDFRVRFSTPRSQRMTYDHKAGQCWGRHVLRTWKETYVWFFYRFLLDPWKCVCVCVYFNFGWTKHKPLVPVWLQTVRNNKVQVPSGEKLNVLLLFLFVDTVLAVGLKLKLGPLEMATFTSMNCSKWRASPSIGFRTAAFL